VNIPLSDPHDPEAKCLCVDAEKLLEHRIVVTVDGLRLWDVSVRQLVLFSIVRGQAGGSSLHLSTVALEGRGIVKTFDGAEPPALADALNAVRLSYAYLKPIEDDYVLDDDDLLKLACEACRKVLPNPEPTGR
jgi:hypothetical protein